MSEQHEQKKTAGCEKFEVALEDYASGELPRRDAERLTAHLENCRECREALEDARLSGRLVTVFSEVVDPGPGFTRRVMAQIDAAERWVREQKSFWRPIEAWSWRLAFSAALAIALLFAYDLKTASVAPARRHADSFSAADRCVYRAGIHIPIERGRSFDGN